MIDIVKCVTIKYEIIDSFLTSHYSLLRDSVSQSGSTIRNFFKNIPYIKTQNISFYGM